MAPLTVCVSLVQISAAVGADDGVEGAGAGDGLVHHGDLADAAHHEAFHHGLGHGGLRVEGMINRDAPYSGRAASMRREQT